MSNFSFPDTPIILKGTVNDNGKYLTTHKLVCKNLKMPLHNHELFFTLCNNYHDRLTYAFEDASVTPGCKRDQINP